MSADRVVKQRSRKSLERSALAESIDLLGTVVDMPCSFCFKRHLDCRMSEGVSRCAECVKRGRSCDGTLVASSLTRLLAEQRKLESDEEATGEEVLALHNRLSELQSQLATAVSRLSRIRKIRKKVKERSSELLRRGMQELDKEDGVLPALDAHEQWVTRDLQSFGVPEDVDWSSLGLGDFSDVGPLVSDGSPSAAPANAASSS